jgi:photosystem II stability/assembly factor-like uncharacterized protein
MKIPCLRLSLTFALCALPLAGVAQDSLPLAHHVSGNVPVQLPSRELAAERPRIEPVTAAQPQMHTPAAHNWKLQATLPGAVIHDLSFPSPLIGYAAAELGQVWKTTDGGATWTEILNLGAPYYFYGVDTLPNNVVVVSGFYDSSSFYSLIRWSKDGGQTWTRDIVVTSTGRAQRVRFPYRNNGLVMDSVGGSSGNIDQVTTDGGLLPTEWTTFVDNPSGGWFGLQYSYLSNFIVRASGINFCTSINGGGQWTCRPSVDSVFDGPVFFLNTNNNDGWVGGGEIGPDVEGWVHVTTDGGKTWSARTLDGPWPIRELLFLNAKTGWAAGGNLYTGVGGIFFSGDGGQTWSVDATTNAEMDACADQPVGTGTQVWCAGYDSSFNGVIYSVTVK